jgi:hypothetical protein
MSVGSISIIYWRALKIVWPAFVKSDHREGLEWSLLLTSVIIEPVFELHAASLNCTVQFSVESTEDQSCVSRSCDVSARTVTGKQTVAVLLIWMVFSVSHEKWALFSSVVSSRPSVFWRFASSFRLWLLCSLHSRSRWPSSGMRPACMKLYFLGHLQSHNLWYCPKWTPIVMFTCWLCIDCLLNTDFWQNISSLGPTDLWTLDQIWVLLCLRVSKCLLIMSADPSLKGQKPGEQNIIQCFLTLQVYFK